MLTDYHVHLRPDEDGTTFARHMTAANAERYRATATERGISELGVSEHVYRFVQALDVWKHPLWRDSAADDIDEYCAFVRGQTDLRLGIEADYIPGREDRMAALLEARDWDYVIGSVHFLGDEAVDYDAYDVWNGGRSPDEVWTTYFAWLAEAAQTKLFDVMAHPDLVKVWGAERPWPEGDLRRFYEPAIAAIADAGVAIEMSTAGLRKPVGELYPSEGFLELAVAAGIPIALSSDAHLAEHLGFRYEDALAALERHGVTEICVFEGRRRRMEPVG